jgi:hypothetical protein
LAVLIGGPTGPFLFDDRLVRWVLDAVRDIEDGRRGSAFIVTSRRTPKLVVEGLKAGLPASDRLFVWGDSAAGNPYAALLGLVDSALVTADSISMQTEFARQGVPLGIIPLSTRWWGRLDRQRRRALRYLSTGPLKSVANGLARLGLPMQIRDFDAFLDGLVSRGLAHRGVPPAQAIRSRAGDELDAVVGRVVALMAA